MWIIADSVVNRVACIALSIYSLIDPCGSHSKYFLFCGYLAPRCGVVWVRGEGDAMLTTDSDQNQDQCYITSRRHPARMCESVNRMCSCITVTIPNQSISNSEKPRFRLENSFRNLTVMSFSFHQTQSTFSNHLGLVLSCLFALTIAICICRWPNGSHCHF